MKTLNAKTEFVEHSDVEQLQAKSKEPLAPATINKYRKTILRALSLAYKNNWINSIPYVGKLKEPKIRIRCATNKKRKSY